jgi:secondary thiamine-phosphate synthase enzyme
LINQIEISLPPYSRGCHLITNLIEKQLLKLPDKGLLHLFIKHTSAGITINENADPTVRVDFETIFNKLIPEGSKDYAHTMEGDDDLPAHIKTSLIGNSITIPISNSKLNMGIWQGIYLCEFRNYGGSRKLVITVYS